MKKKPLILVIDSDKNILWAFKNFLSKNKIDMVGKRTIEEGLKILQGNNFNLIITDLRADLKAGINFIQEAKKIADNIPIITTTSYPDIINARMLKKYGIDYLFIKPPDIRNLQAAVTNCLKSEVRNESKNKITH
ncbi:MAG TPA: response regulator [Ignavibacteriaceae bacterium]|nr:response regulator [Ignavibacteriaceae bacterium]